MDQMQTIARVSGTGKLNLPARPRGDTLVELQAQARGVFAGSGETVEGFVRERHEESAREESGS